VQKTEMNTSPFFALSKRKGVLEEMTTETNNEIMTKLYDMLFIPYPEFCKEVSWLGEEAISSDNPTRFENMWTIYLSVMTKIGQKLFGSDVYWNTSSDQIEPVLDMLLNQGYSDIIIQLILGANNLFYQVKSDGYEHKMSKLREIANQYYGIVRQYRDGGVLTIEDRMVKWDFIDHSNRLFGAAYDIVEASSRPPKSPEQLKVEQEHQDEMQRTLEDKFDELFGGLEHPVRYKIKRFFKKLFSKKKR